MSHPLDKQMKFAFMDGGAVGEVDPVSGNPVPPGSEPENVRDDIDAKLSEGEYVIPANVVNFYGIDKFRKMIQKAEEQLGEMEAEGQIGGEPAAPEEDDLPFSTEELAVAEDTPALEMATGGVVYNPNAAMTSGGMENRMYTNAQGQKRPFLFFNGMPVMAIPQGWYPDTQENRKSLQGDDPTVQSASGIGWGQGDADTDNNKDATKTTKTDVTQWTTEDFENLAEQQTIVDTMSRGLGLAGPGGLLIGGAMRKGNQMTINRAMDELMERIKNPETADEDRTRLQKVYEDFANQDKDDEKDGLFSGITDRIFGENGFFGSFGKPKATASTSSTPSISAFKSTRSTGEGDTGGSSLAPSVSSRPASRSTAQQQQATQQTQRTQSNVSSGTGSDPTTHGFEKDDPRSQGMYKGGYVKRRKK